MRTTWLFRWVRYGVTAYFLLAALMFFGQRQLQYITYNSHFNADVFGVSGFAAVPVKLDSGVEISSWYRPPLHSDLPVIVSMHGNAGSFASRAFYIMPWLEAGYGVALVGYPGFDGNEGSPNEQRLYQSARGLIKSLHEHGVSPSKIILHGESLGTGVAVQMATEFSVAAVILESPYTNMADVAVTHYPIFPVRWMVWDKFDSAAKIDKVHAPLLIIHGDADKVVPFKLGEQLFAMAHQPKEFMAVAHAGHGGGLFIQSVNDKMMEFIGRVSR
jgi:dipeptidyl aminopeptidase/acylaminoacyl peptidase